MKSIEMKASREVSSETKDGHLYVRVDDPTQTRRTASGVVRDRVSRRQVYVLIVVSLMAIVGFVALRRRRMNGETPNVAKKDIPRHPPAYLLDDGMLGLEAFRQMPDIGWGEESEWTSIDAYKRARQRACPWPSTGRPFANVTNSYTTSICTVALKDSRSDPCSGYFANNSEYAKVMNAFNGAGEEVGNELNIHFCEFDVDAIDGANSHESTVTWTTQRIGPFVSRGGYDWHSIAGWRDVGDFVKRGILLPPDDMRNMDEDDQPYIELVGSYIAPIDERSEEPLLLPPLHIHHLHIYPSVRADRMDLERHDILLERHGDSGCHFHNRSDLRGDECLFRLLPRGHAFRIAEAMTIDFEINDVRSKEEGRELPDLRFYVEIALAWRTRARSNAISPLTYLSVGMPCAYPSPCTYPLLHNEPSVMWGSWISDMDGSMVPHQFIGHAHHAAFDSFWVFLGDGASKKSLGLHDLETSFWDLCTPGDKDCQVDIPVTASNLGLKSIDDLKVWIACRAIQTERGIASSFGPRTNASRASLNLADEVEQCRQHFHHPSDQSASIPPLSLACVAKKSFDETSPDDGDLSKVYDRRMSIWCRPDLRLKSGEHLTVVVFNEGGGQIPINYNPFNQQGFPQHTVFRTLLKNVSLVEHDKRNSSSSFAKSLLSERFLNARYVNVRWPDGKFDHSCLELGTCI